MQVDLHGMCSAARTAVALTLAACTAASAQSFQVQGSFGNHEGCNLAMGRQIVNESLAMLRSGEFFYFSMTPCANPQISAGADRQYILTADCEMSKTHRFTLTPMADRPGFVLSGTDYGVNEYMNLCQ